LLQNGADPNTGHILNNPISRALDAKNVDCLRLLLQYGANPEESLFKSVGMFDQKWAMQSTELLIEAGADVNNIDVVWGTPLHRALNVTLPNIEMVKLLIQHGASATQAAMCDIMGHRTWLHWFRIRTRYVTPLELVSENTLYLKSVDREHLQAILKGEEYHKSPL
jgi:ankyrin repeat protein